jgi:hypothetical protein
MTHTLSTINSKNLIAPKLLLLASISFASAHASGIDLISLSAHPVGSPQSTASYTLNSSQLTHHVVPWQSAPFQFEIYDDYQSAAAAPLRTQSGQDIGSISNVDYEFAEQHFRGLFDIDPLLRQTTKFTLAAGAEDLVVSFRVQYQWELVLFNNDSLDDSGSIFISGEDTNHNGQMFMRGGFPPGWALQSYYDIPAEGYSSIVSIIGGMDSGGVSTPVTNSSRFDSIPRRRPAGDPSAARVSLYTNASFTLSAGDTVSFDIFRGIPSPGTLALVFPALLLSSRRRRD